jgi:hypothetical protein
VLPLVPGQFTLQPAPPQLIERVAAGLGRCCMPLLLSTSMHAALAVGAHAFLYNCMHSVATCPACVWQVPSMVRGRVVHILSCAQHQCAVVALLFRYRAGDLSHRLLWLVCLLGQRSLQARVAWWGFSAGIGVGKWLVWLEWPVSYRL